MEIRHKLQVPEKLRFLFNPATTQEGRYKVLYGGRGSMKSWGVARALLIMGANPRVRYAKGFKLKRYRWLCAREIQNSIRESVHELLASQILSMGLQEYYVVEQATIFGRPNTTAQGTEFIFKGLHANVTEIKSIEGLDGCWVEEANKVKRTSWDILVPTVREEYDDGTVSEIIVTFNPELADDEAYRRFVNPANRPANATVVEVNWRDNPWFPSVLATERDEMKRVDEDGYLTIWEGKCRQTLEGAVFAKELRRAKEEGRITRFKPERAVLVSTYWDLGRADKTAIWFVQRVGLQWRIIDFYQNNQYDIDHYIGILQTKGYKYDTHFLPHDGAAKQLGSKRTIQEQLRGDDERFVRIVPRQSIVDQHNAARSIFANCWFEEDACAEGLNCLGRYCYEVDPDTKQFSQRPLHDENSHAASAFMQFAIAAREPVKPTRASAPPAMAFDHGQGWLS